MAACPILKRKESLVSFAHCGICYYQLCRKCNIHGEIKYRVLPKTCHANCTEYTEKKEIDVCLEYRNVEFATSTGLMGKVKFMEKSSFGRLLLQHVARFVPNVQRRCRLTSAQNIGM